MKKLSVNIGTLYDVSVILTGYNEGPILEENLNRVEDILKSTRYSWELILIDDKSQDNTPVVFQKFAKGKENVHVYCHLENVGRGGTVMEGILKAHGKIVGYLDTDLELSPVHIPEFIRSIEKGADLAIATRIYRVRLNNLIRTLMSSGYIMIAQNILGISFEDTEAGFKFFNRQRILPVLKQVKDKRWFFDTEIVMRSAKKHFKIEEIPVIFIRKPEKQSSVRLFRDTILYARNLKKFRHELRLKS